jgi:hypothetical protein
MTPYEAFFEHLALTCDEWEHANADERPNRKADVIRRFRHNEVLGGNTGWVDTKDPWAQAEQAAAYCYEGGEKPQWMIDMEGHRD